MSFMRPWMSRLTRLPAMALFAFALTAPASVAFAQDDDQADEDVEDQPVEEEVGDGEIADTDASAVVVFRDRLSPYGSWVETPDYGLVWVPASHVVGAEFSPYVSAGHWELTEEGDWLWVSDYEWGAIPFHYGRWVWAGDMGWAWVPGRVYSPAWVTWRVGADGYIGWAPLPAWYYWVGGVAYYHHHHFHAAYSFCHTDHVFHHHVHTQVIREKAEVQKAAKATRNYTSASPSKGGAVSGGNARKAASPSLDEAGVKSANAPKSRSKGDPRALEFSKPDSIKKSKEQSAKMKSASKDKPSRGNAIGFAAPSVETQRAKHEATRAKNPARTKPASDSRSSGRTFDGPSEGRSSSKGASRSQGASRSDGGSFESRRNDGPSPRSESRTTRRSSKGSSGRFERRSSGDSPSSSPSRGSSSAPRTTRSKRTNSGSSAPSTRSSAPSTRSHADSPSRSSAPPTSSSPSRAVPKSSAPSRGSSRGGRRGR